MKKIFVIVLLISAIAVAKPAYATIDIMATIQSGIELKTEITSKIQEIQKKVMDVYKRAVQGFQAAKNCLANPMQCDIETLASIGRDAVSGVKSISGVRTIKGPEELQEGDLKQKDAKNLDKAIINSYTYEKGQEDAIRKTKELKDEINAVKADEVAILFAKGIVVRQSIRNEKADEIYSNDLGASQSDILAAHNTLILKSQERLSRILELRAYMIGADATAELEKNMASQEEMREQLNN